jgi:hypothetical protein
MAKTWVLDTETKGTGAHVVPVEKTLERKRREPDLALVEFDRPASSPQPTEPAQSLRFKVVDVMSAKPLAEDVDARDAVRALERMHSVVDVRVYRWDAERDRWRLLTLEESKALWAFRGRLAPVGSDPAE